MKSLASVRDAIDIYEDRLDSDYINEIGPNLNFKTSLKIKWGASSRWSFRPNFACSSTETATIGKTHPTLYRLNSRIRNRDSDFEIFAQFLK